MATKQETDLLALILSSPDPHNPYLFPVIKRINKVRPAFFKLINAKVDVPEIDEADLKYRFKYKGKWLNVNARLNVWTYHSDDCIECDINISLNNLSIDRIRYQTDSYVNVEIPRCLLSVDELDGVDFQDMLDRFDAMIVEFYEERLQYEVEAAERAALREKWVQRNYKAWLKQLDQQETEQTQIALDLVEQYLPDSDIAERRKFFVQMINLINHNN